MGLRSRGNGDRGTRIGHSAGIEHGSSLDAEQSARRHQAIEAQVQEVVPVRSIHAKEVSEGDRMNADVAGTHDRRHGEVDQIAGIQHASRPIGVGDAAREHGANRVEGAGRTLVVAQVVLGRERIGRTSFPLDEVGPGPPSLHLGQRELLSGSERVGCGAVVHDPTVGGSEAVHRDLERRSRHGRVAELAEEQHRVPLVGFESRQDRGTGWGHAVHREPLDDDRPGVDPGREREGDPIGERGGWAHGGREHGAAGSGALLGGVHCVVGPPVRGEDSDGDFGGCRDGAARRRGNHDCRHEGGGDETSSGSPPVGSLSPHY